MKKLMALVLALILCVALACPAFAVGTENVDDAVATDVVDSPEVTPPVDPEPPVDPDKPVEPQPPVDPDQPVGPQPGDDDDNALGVPETGDQSQASTALLVGLMVLSFMGIVAVSALLWKKRVGSKA